MAGTASDIARWTGATDGNWGTAGNWTTEAGSPSTPPTTGERALFDHRAPSQSVTAGLDQSAVDLNRITVTEGYRGSIGVSGTPLKIGVSNGTSPQFIYASKTGSLYLDGTGASSAPVDALYIESTGNGNVTLAGGIVTALYIYGGTVIANSGCDITNATQLGGIAQIASDATAITSYLLVAGEVGVTSRNLTAMTIGPGGALRTYGTTATTTCSMYGGRWTNNSSGTITTLNGYTGLWTIAGSPHDCTITTLNEYLPLFRIIERTPGASVTIGTRNQIGVGAA